MRQTTKTKRSVTIADVAREASVSTATVSHVLNRTRVVNPGTVAAVEAAISATGYTPNTTARSLARSSSSTIGVAVSAISNHYFSEVVSAIESACSENDLMMFLSDTHDDPQHQLRVVRELFQRRVDGIILAPTEDRSSEVLAFLRKNGVSTVLIDRVISSEFDQVGCENVQATAVLVQHLVEHGHRRIGFVAGRANLSTSQERLEGFRRGLKLAMIPEEGELVVDGDSRVSGACDAVRGLLAGPRRPTALVTGNNLMTIGALRALREVGVRVPEDMALVGFDDFDWAEFASPPLTLMAQPTLKLGRVSLDLLVRRLNNPSGGPRTVRLSPKLQIRHSCGCVRLS
jgi:LacI family transcriptional regulator